LKTKNRILEAALELFNIQGVTEVTTHHVASKCGISPGNLYYHYRNKEEIIRALFDQALVFISEQEKTIDTTGKATTNTIEQSLTLLSTLNWRYRFLKRDLPIILMNDLQLQEKFHAIHQQQISNLNRDIKKAMNDGLYKELSPVETMNLSKIFWLVALFWPTFLEVSGDGFTKENLDKGIDLIRLLVNTVLSEQGRKHICLGENK
jgi:AcrR family transcriptional regulator